MIFYPVPTGTKCIMIRGIYLLVLAILFILSPYCHGLIDPSVPGVTKNPVVYMPFENTNGTYGPGTGDNPAWLNHAANESPVIVDRGNTYWPLIGSNAGVKGDYFDGTSMNGGTSQADIITFNDDTGATIPSLSELKSHTVTFWIRTGSDQVKGPDNYVLRGPFQVHFGADGRMGTHWWPNLSWNASGPDDYMSYGKWLFVAITVDQNGIKYYRGDPENAPVLVSRTDVTTGTSLTNPWLFVGWRTYVSAVYMNFDLDELRMWASKTDNSGALSAGEIEAVWAYDYAPSSWCGDQDHPVPEGDLNKDCVVDIEDFYLFTNYWYLQSAIDIDAFAVDTLDRIFADQRPDELAPDADIHHAPRGSKTALTFAVHHIGNAMCDIRVSTVTNQYNDRFPGTATLYHAQSVPVEANNNGCSATAVGVVPNPSWHPCFIRMAPFETAEALKPAGSINLQSGKYHGVVLEFDIPQDAPIGKYQGWLEFIIGDEIRSVPFSFTVHKTQIEPENHVLHADYWLDADPENLTAQSPPSWWSSEHWQLLENSGRTLRRFGLDGLFTPTIYTAHPLVDITKLRNGTYTFNFDRFDIWAQTFFALGFEYLEGEHLFARADGLPIGLIYGYDQDTGYFAPLIGRNISMQDWHAFLTSFCQSLYAHLQANGWAGKYKQHLMDEPGDASILANAYAVIKAAMPDVQTLDAIHSWGQDPANFSPYTDNFIFYIDLLDNHQALAQQRLTEGKTNWAYYFCKPHPPGPHPTLDAHLTMCRLFPMLCYKYNATGMIFWAANRYRGADPYTSSIGPGPSGSQNPGHPPGDCWYFYPVDNGLVGSVRMLNFREGMIDHQLLSMVKDQDPARASQLLDMLLRSMSDYERYDNSVYYQFRKQVLEELDGNF